MRRMLSRRQVVVGLGAGIAMAGHIGRAGAAAYPFTLGVASGDPSADGFVIWTRLAPDPFYGGGMPAAPAEVRWEIAADEGFTTIVGVGAAPALPQSAHTLHVEIGGLEPARDYFYRFMALGERSPVGRARTLPAAGAAVAELRFGVAGCQRWEHGYFTAYRHLAAENFDFVFHFGDYIYEYAYVREGRPGNPPIIRAMPEQYKVCTTLADYRNRYALYKSDPDLQAAHESAPFVISFDDHELENDWTSDHSVRGYEAVPAAQFLRRRASAFQAWYEHTPVRSAQAPQGPDILAYRRFAVGGLATMNVLDTRQYRSPQLCGGAWSACDAARDLSRTMMGAAQEKWLYAGLAESRTPWNVLAQQVPLMQRDLNPSPEILVTEQDKWDSAPAARDRLFKTIEDAKTPGIVSVEGDVHANWAGDLKKDFNDMNSPTLGVDLVSTSIASEGDGADTKPSNARMAASNPHIKFYNDNRGYLRNVVTPDRWRADFRIVPKVSVRDQPILTRKSLAIEARAPGLKDA